LYNTNRTTLAVRRRRRRDLFVFNDTIEGPRAPAVKPVNANNTYVLVSLRD
jgi:hypothetical protein